jgi:hypothetical protein
MSLKYGTLCFVLFLIVVFLALKNYEALTSPLELTPDKGEVKKETKHGPSPKMEVTKEPQSIVSYNSIAEKNIFNPDRKDFPTTGSGMSKKPVVRPQIVLYGITIAGDYQSASVVNPGRPLKKGEREQMTLKLGERIGEYKLAKISSDRVTLETEGDIFEVLLYDPKMPKNRATLKTESKPATITSAQASSIQTRDGKGEKGSSTSLPTLPGTPGSSVRKEGVGETKGQAQGQSRFQPPGQVTSPLPFSPGSGLPSTPTQVPVPMTPTPNTSPMSLPIPVPAPSTAPLPVPLPGGK